MIFRQLRVTITASLQIMTILGGAEAQAQLSRTATASANVVNGFVVGITLTDQGFGYASAPAITIAGGGGIGATAVATILNGIVDKIIVQTAGSGYTNSPFVLIAPPPVQGLSFLTNGLVAYYPFNGNANDESGSGNNGVVSNALLTIDRWNIPNKAYAFNGSNSVIRVQDSASLRIGLDITLSCWVEFDDAQLKEVRLVGKASGDNRSYGLWYKPTEPSYWLFQQFVGSGGAVQENTGPSPVTVLHKQWYNVVGVRRGNQSFLYVNGIILASTTHTSTPVYIGPEPLLIGNYEGAVPPDNRYQVMSGSIDDIRIYNRAFSDLEVKALYDYERQPMIQVPRRATATATVVNGFIVDIAITDVGYGYTNTPSVEVIGLGSGATAVANMTNGQVTKITVANAGSGYSTNTLVRIQPPPKYPALSIAIQTVRLTFSVWEGKHYIVESSSDLIQWRQQLDIVAEADILIRDFSVTESGQYFRIKEVP